MLLNVQEHVKEVLWVFPLPALWLEVKDGVWLVLRP
jgi:hypothetical protein